MRRLSSICGRDHAAQGMSNQGRRVGGHAIDEAREICRVVSDPICGRLRGSAVAMPTKVQCQQSIGINEGGGEEVPPVGMCRAAMQEHHRGGCAVTPFAVVESEPINENEVIASLHERCCSHPGSTLQSTPQRLRSVLRAPSGEVSIQSRHDLGIVADEPVIGILEYRRLGVLVDGHDDAGASDTHHVLEGAAECDGKV